MMTDVSVDAVADVHLIFLGKNIVTVEVRIDTWVNIIQKERKEKKVSEWVKIRLVRIVCHNVKAK